MVHSSPFCLFSSYLVHFVHFSFIQSILSYSVHIDPFWPTSVQHIYFSLIGSRSIHFVHFGLIRSYSVHMSPILSTSVLFGQHCLIWSILSTLVLFGPIRIEWNAKWKNSQRMRNMVESNALTCDDPRHFLSTNMWASHSWCTIPFILRFVFCSKWNIYIYIYIYIYLVK